MNILELCLSPGLGGLELYVYRASNALKNNHNITAALHRDSKLDTYYKEHSTIDRVYLNRSNSLIPISNAKKLSRIIDDNKTDVIHMHWGNDLALAALAKYFSKRKPALVYTRQMTITRSKNDFYHNFLYRKMDLMLTISKELEALAKRFIRRHANKITTLYYGVKQPDKFLHEDDIKQQREQLGFSENDFITGLFGRLEKSKGQHLLIKAIHMAKNNNENIHALIVGHEMEQGYRENLINLAAELDVSNNIKFQDFVSNPQQLMQLCDCIALASNRETFGLVLPEAMRSGVAVIGSNSGGVPEIIDSGKTGLLFETDKAESLYQAMQTLYANPELRKNLAAKGREKADKMFNENNHFSALEQHLKRVA